MAHSFTNLLYHIVFATKNREPVLDSSLRPDLLAFLGSAIRDEGGIALIVNGVADHVHILAKLRPDIAVSDVLRMIKSRSSAWIHRKVPDLASFAWQTGFGVFSVSQSQVPNVQIYIERQEDHHKRIPYEQELRTLLRKNGLDVDETFLWE